MSLSNEFVFIFQNQSTFLSELWSDGSAELDVSLHLLHSEFWVDCSFFKSVHVYDVLGDVEIVIVVLFVEDDEENVESGHNWRRDIDVESERFGSVVSSVDWVGCS